LTPNAHPASVTKAVAKSPTPLFQITLLTARTRDPDISFSVYRRPADLQESHKEVINIRWRFAGGSNSRAFYAFFTASAANFSLVWAPRPVLL
jgi:hypothetical protein